MSHGIDIRESVEDKDTWFNVKRFSIGNVSFARPQKSLDIKKIDRRRYAIIASKFPFAFAESSKRVPGFHHLEQLYAETDSSRISEMFSQRVWLGGAPLVLNFTFGFNPIKHMDKKAVFDSFLDYYYHYSNFFLTVPSVRIKKWVRDAPDSKKSHQEQIATIADYVVSVDLFYDTLSKKNKKPIFVPISVRMSAKDIDELVDHYVKTERYSYWIDFDGMAVNPTTLGRLRHLFNRVKEKGHFDDTVTYFTNVKREIISNVKKEKSEASDILSSVAGANLIGCNREPNRLFDPHPPSVPPEHKARVFDMDSYYYVKTRDSSMFSPEMYVTTNAINLNEEIGNQTEFFFSNGNLEPLLSRKEMLVTYKEGEVLRDLLSRRDNKRSPEFADTL